MRQPVKIACDGRQRRRDDRLVERRWPIVGGPSGIIAASASTVMPVRLSPASPGAVSRGTPFEPSTLVDPIVT
jgi:hypothetical protein